MTYKYDVKYTVLANYSNGLYYDKKKKEPIGYVVSPCYLVNEELNEVVLPINSNGDNIINELFDENGNYLTSSIVKKIFDTRSEAYEEACCLNKLIGAKMQIFCYNNYYRKSLSHYYTSLADMMKHYNNNMKICNELQNKIYESCKEMMIEKIDVEKVVEKKKTSFIRRKK